MNTAQIVDVQENKLYEKTFASLDTPDEEESYNLYDDPDINTVDSETGECLSWYDWFADSATTSHIVNQHDIFKTYRPFIIKQEI